MKRLVWLVILVFGTALAQVSPLDLGHPQPKACSCCDHPGDCSKSGCELPAACAPTNFVCESPARTTAEMAPQIAEAPDRVTPVSAVDPRAPHLAHLTRYATIARVSLFKVHCSFLI